MLIFISTDKCSSHPSLKKQLIAADGGLAETHSLSKGRDQLLMLALIPSGQIYLQHNSCTEGSGNITEAGEEGL